MKIARLALAIIVGIALMPGFAGKPAKVTAKTAKHLETSLIVEFKPDVLTAGVVSELIDVQEPFMIVVRDSEGNPVDLTNGGKFDAKTVWNKCFLDPHPDNQEFFGKDAKLPQYYWTRTDMHNDDGTAVCNKKLFGKEFIEIDFKRASQGIYIFNNFVANDRGEFKVFVRTIDGKKEGNCDVRVKKPKVYYKITNLKDENLIDYETPGDPDFVMTAADNRIYKIKVECYSARGEYLKGTTGGYPIYGGKYNSRFTPFIQMPENTLWTKVPDQKEDRNVYASGTCRYLTNTGGRYGLNIGFDFNGDQRLNVGDKELFSFAPQKVYDVANKKWTPYLTYYTCFNAYYKSSGFTTKPAFDMPVENNKGWGLGCIYNRDFIPDTTNYEKDESGYMFVNLDEDPRITYKDSLTLDINAQTEFYLFAQDVCRLGGLVGCSVMDLNDFAGCPPKSPTSPYKVVTRYKPDGVYCLDFDAMPSEKASIEKPRLSVVNPLTQEELSKSYLDPNSWDLADSLENNVTLLFRPADPREYVFLYEDSSVSIVDKMGKEVAVRTTQHSEFDEHDSAAIFSFTPTTDGQEVYEVRYFTDNLWYNMEPYNLGTKVYELRQLAYFDVVPGIVLNVEFDKTPVAGETVQLTVTCLESGSKTPIAGALVRLSGCDADFEMKTDSSGVVTKTVTFSEACKARIYASQSGYASAQPYMFEVKDSPTPPSQDPLPPTLLKPPNKAMLAVSTMPNNLVLEWSKPANWNENMEYYVLIAKLDPVTNTILKADFRLIFKTSQDRVQITPFDQINLVTKSKGFVLEYGTKYTWLVATRFATKDMDSKEWYGTSDYWEFTTPDKSNTSDDSSGCPDECRKTMSFKIDSKDWKICDHDQPQMTAAPVIRNSKTFLVIKYIAETIGATVNWYAEQKVVEIISPSDMTTIYLQIDNNEAEVNGKLVKIDDNQDIKPFILGGRTMLPLRFISENLGLEVEWNGATRTVGIGFKPPECKPKIDFTLKDTAGKSHTLSSYRGKPVILDFTASWCGWCIKAAPDLDKVAKKYQGKVQVLSIDMGEDQATAKKFREDLNADWPFLVDADKKVSGQFRVNGIPHFVILDGKGVIRYVQSGYNDKIFDIFSREIDKLL